MGQKMLSSNQIAALAECASYRARRQDYWWRLASMRRLSELGFVEECPPQHAIAMGYRGKSMAYRPTQAGLDFLTGFPDASA